MARILIIDDDPVFGELTTQRLEILGYETTFHEGSFGALNAIITGDYDLVILDVHMPGLDGPKLAREILGGHWGLPESLQIALTSSQDEDGIARAASAVGVAHYWSKSVSFGEFKAHVQVMLAAKARIERAAA